MSDAARSPRLRATGATGLSVVCVFYEAEAELCALLARSLERFLDPQLVDSILFLNNCQQPAEGQRLFDSLIRPEFRRFAAQVQCRDAAEFGMAPRDAADSYLTQQALKLEVARQLQAPFYLLFDAKNHLIRPLDRGALFAADGRPRNHWAHHQGYLRTRMNRSLEFFGVTVPADRPGLPTVTPYLMITDVVVEMLEAIAARIGGPVIEAIRADDKRTEFMLYYGHVAARHGVETLYDMGLKPYATLFTRWPQQAPDVLAVLASTGRPEVHTLGIHIKRFAQLTPEQITVLAGIWQEAGLFPNVDAAEALIHQQRAKASLPAATAPAAVPPPVSSDPVSGSVSSGPDAQARAMARGVLIGRNGRLFLADGPERVLDQHRGLCPMPAAQLALWPELLTARVRAAKAAGAEYALLIAPDAHAIHREDIPELDGTDHRRPVQQILQALGVRPRFCYPLEALRRARTQGEVCHSAGQHWTGFGAYRACRRLLRQLPFALALPERGQVDFVTRAGDGDPEAADLGARLDPPRAGRQTDCVIRKPGARKLWQNGVTGMGHMAYWRHWRQDLPRGLLLADGSGRVLQRLLAEAFSELLVVETHGYEAEAVAAFGPDVILSVMAERFMIHPPVDGAAPSALDAARQTDRAARYPLRTELALL